MIHLFCFYCCNFVQIWSDLSLCLSFFFFAVSIHFGNTVLSSRILPVLLVFSSVHSLLRDGIDSEGGERKVNVPYFSFVCVSFNFHPLLFISFHCLIAKKHHPSSTYPIILKKQYFHVAATTSQVPLL